MKRLLSPDPLWQNCGIAALRIITGIFLIYHGLEVFDAATMQQYAGWDMFKFNSTPALMPYIGKGAELLAGVLLAIGLLTRVACIIIICTFLYISLLVGHGKIWYDDQHPFMFVLMGLVFFFTGPGSISADRVIFKRKS